MQARGRTLEFGWRRAIAGQGEGGRDDRPGLGEGILGMGVGWPREGVGSGYVHWAASNHLSPGCAAHSDLHLLYSGRRSAQPIEVTGTYPGARGRTCLLPTCAGLSTGLFQFILGLHLDTDILQGKSVIVLSMF